MLVKLTLDLLNNFSNLRKYFPYFLPSDLQLSFTLRREMLMLFLTSQGPKYSVTFQLEEMFAIFILCVCVCVRVRVCVCVWVFWDLRHIIHEQLRKGLFSLMFELTFFSCFKITVIKFFHEKFWKGKFDLHGTSDEEETNSYWWKFREKNVGNPMKEI